MILFRFTCTLTQGGDIDSVVHVVAKDAASARSKAMFRLTNGLPFWTFRASDIVIAKNGPL